MLKDTNQPSERQKHDIYPVKKWNWGAFLLNWIWGLGNRSPKALLCFIPVFGFFWVFVCGAKGDEWAWKNKKWKSADHFRHVQRKWVKAAILFWVIFIALDLYWFFFGKDYFNSYPPVTMELSKLNSDNHSIKQLGKPIKRNGDVEGGVEWSLDFSSANAQLNWPIIGPLGKARIYIYAVKNPQTGWTIKNTELRNYMPNKN